MRDLRVGWGLVVLSACVVLGCAGEPGPDPAYAANTEAAAEQSEGTPIEETRIRWKAADETVLLELKPKGADYKLYDGADQPLGKARVKDDRVKLKDADGNETHKFKKKEDGLEIEDGGGNRLYRIKLGEDGSYKLRDAADTTLVRLKKKDDGYEVRDADGATLAKVKGRDGKVVFKSEEGESLSTLKGIEDARAAMWLAAEPLSLSERAALVVYFVAVD